MASRIARLIKFFSSRIQWPKMIGVILSLSMLLEGCRPRMSDMACLYLKTDGEIKEQLRLEPDGSFDQTVVIDRNTYHYSGKWKIETNDSIRLSNYAEVIDPEKPHIVVDPPNVHQSYLLLWNKKTKGLEYIGNPDMGYYKAN